MYFYYFLPFLSSDFTDFTDFSLCLEPQTTQTDAKIIYDSCRCNLLFLCLPCRPWFHVVTPSGVDPSQASRGEWWRLFAILADCKPA